ncbi:MAG: hypothetical protein J6R04_02960, partial [Clostridia bacterium]|nr:hypothetical protein [Clostridia bacterium]
MKPMLSRALLMLLALLLTVTLWGCGGDSSDKPTDDGTGDPDKQPGEDATPDEEDLSHLPSVPSEREMTVTQGLAIHENADALGRIPQGLAEVVNQYMSNYEGMNLQGAKTTFQTHTYTELQQLPSDAVMVYYAPRSGAIGAIREWAKLDDEYELHMMTIINRTDEQTYLSEHADQIMTDVNGDYLTNGSEHYMMPNDEWTDYVWSFLEPALEVADIQTIVFEEPDLYKASGYSASFKREWEKYYGEPWQDQTTSPEAMIKSQQLKVYLLNRMMEIITARIREKCPNIKIYIATHSTLSYNVTKNSGKSDVRGLASGMNTYLNAGIYDGMIGQTWTDTAGAQLTKDGNPVSSRFLAGYLGYASYVDVVGDLDLFTLADPVGDGI